MFLMYACARIMCMGRYDSIIFLITLFLITNGLGLVAAAELQQHEEVRETAEQHSSAEFGLYFFLMIGIATVLLLLLYKYKLNFAVKGWLVLALGLTTLIFFTTVFESILGLIATAAVLLGIVYSKDHMLRNVLMIFPFAGAGAFFGSVIGLQAALVLLVVLSLYDYFSVNISEHMVNLAKSGVQTNTFMGFTYPKEDGGIPLEDTDMEDGDSAVYRAEDEVEPADAASEGADAASKKGGVGLLGGGDIVIPLVFAATLLPDYGMFVAVVSVLGAAAGLSFLLVKAQAGRFYPAIPPVAIGSVAGFGVGWMLLEVVFAAL